MSEIGPDRMQHTSHNLQDPRFWLLCMAWRVIAMRAQEGDFSRCFGTSQRLQQQCVWIVDRCGALTGARAPCTCKRVKESGVCVGTGLRGRAVVHVIAQSCFVLIGL